MNWLWIGAAGFAVLGGIATWCLIQRRWTGGGLAVGGVNLLLAMMNSVAPIRGWADADYRGFSFGYLRVEQGPGVTLVAGALLLGAALCAVIALLHRTGRPMFFVAAFDGVLALDIGTPLVSQLVRDPQSVTIQLGEYLTIGPLAATLILIGLFAAPLALSAYWAVRRVRLAEPRPSAGLPVYPLDATLHR
jgi:hypothetical protein